MKKTILVLAIAVSMLLTAGMPSFASTVEEPLNQDQTIPGEGYIGIDETGGIDDLIKLEVPGDFYWYVNENTAPEVKSSDYWFTNKSPNVTLTVKLISFNTVNNVALPGNLDLRLTGDLGADGVGDTNILNFQGPVEYSQPFRPNEELHYTFSGTYEGRFPGVAVKPTYNMLLNFSIREVAPVTAEE